MTPSANCATRAACDASLTPSPTPTGSAVCARTRATSPDAASLTTSRAPVTPITDAA